MRIRSFLITASSVTSTLEYSVWLSCIESHLAVVKVSVFETSSLNASLISGKLRTLFIKPDLSAK